MNRIAFTLLTISFAATAGHALDWPQWRGPNGNGVSGEKGLPVTWTNDKNIAWRAKLEGQGVSSPIVSGDQVIVTSQVGSPVIAKGRLLLKSDDELIAAGN